MRAGVCGSRTAENRPVRAGRASCELRAGPGVLEEGLRHPAHHPRPSHGDALPWHLQQPHGTQGNEPGATSWAELCHVAGRVTWESGSSWA